MAEDVTQFQQRGLKPSSLLIPALGTILTREKDVLSSWLVREMKKKYQRVFQTITNKHMSTQVAFTLLRMCAVPLVNYWMRTTPPPASYDLAREFDLLVMQAASEMRRGWAPKTLVLSRRQWARKGPGTRGGGPTKGDSTPYCGTS
jgi:hypothetical protein